MAEAARQEFANPSVAGDAPLIAADVGGTYARIGLVNIGSGAPQVSTFERYRCSDFSDLSSIFQRFLGDHGSDGHARARRGAIAIAGYVLDDAIINNNLPWRVSLSQIRRALDLDDLQVINDFTAIAYATNSVAARDVTPIAATSAPLEGPVLVVGPGTGLGAAVRIPTARSTVILSTEAGQSALTASTDLEIEILRMLLRDTTHVPVEHVLSGPGLANLYAVLGTLRGMQARSLTPREIAESAIDGSDALAVEALHVFCGWLGSVVGNLVLVYGAQGGVHLAGGILPQITDFLLRSDFAARFRDKGQMRDVLERVPVHLIEHGQLGVIGAAQWYLEQQ
ncbi:MAG TPA: glucokinase [Rudaea sp.]|nr:glucokinase [Rudaea sp.]